MLYLCLKISIYLNLERKTMKYSIFLTSLFACSLLTLVTSCNKDDNNSTAAASNFVGTYGRVYDCGNGAFTDIDLEVFLAAQDDQVVFSDLFGVDYFGDDITITISGNDFTFSDEYVSQFDEDNNWTAGGTGSMSSDKQKITIDYTINQFSANPPSTTCTLVLTRK